jgi:hypothetical protein
MARRPPSAERAEGKQKNQRVGLAPVIQLGIE